MSRAQQPPPGRRGFLRSFGVGSAAVLVGCSGAERARSASGSIAACPPQAPQAEAPLPLTSDLMREHGVVERVLLVYEEVLRRLESGRPVPHLALHDTAQLVRSYIEGLHEQLEERFVFPRLEQHPRLAPTVETLVAQHRAGAEMTDAILAASRQPVEGSEALRTALHGYVWMYRPHAAREDTVVFPSFREVVPPEVQLQLAHRLEEIEERRLGAAGFGGVVDRVEQLEQAFEIHDLAAYTPSQRDLDRLVVR